MAATKSCFWHVCILQGILAFFSFAVANERPTLDMRLTRQLITTSLGQPANLGCYATHINSSSLKYFWTKDNVNVTPSSNIEVYGNVLVVTPKENDDFGTYECRVSNGVISTRCNISLLPGCNDTDDDKNPGVVIGCVNLSVLMPVLAVMVVSLLLNVHFIVQWKRRQQWILSEEDILQLQLAHESLAVNHEEQEDERSEMKKTKMFGGRFSKKRQKDCDETGQHIEKNDKDHEENARDSSKHEENKEEAIEMQERTDFTRMQDNSRAIDSPSAQDNTREPDRPVSQEIPRLQDILHLPELSPTAQDSMHAFESPRSLDSPRTKGIPRLEDIFREQEGSPHTQDSSRVLDSPRALDSPRSEIPRLEEFLGTPEVTVQETDETARDSLTENRRSGVVQAPRIAEFFFPADESDNESGERQSVDSEEPLVSHYMEKMDFEKGSEDDEHDEEPLVSHYMEKMDFEGASDDEGTVLK